ncbi:MAG: sialidase family protein [Candidatus Natronoplasma sp.]
MLIISGIIVVIGGEAVGKTELDNGLEKNSETTNLEYYFSGGDGSLDDPYQIEDWNGLDAVREDLTAHYELIDDLDENTSGYDEHASSTANDGAGWDPIGDADNMFTGYLYGRSHLIKDLYIDRPDAEDIGLIGSLQSGGMENVRIESFNILGGDNVGSAIGYSSGSNVTGITAESISIEASSDRIGGLIGDSRGGSRLERSSISWSEVKADEEESDRVGGIIGHLEQNSLIIESHSNVNIVGYRYVGGIVGDVGSNSEVRNSYAIGEVDGASQLGGLIGRLDGTSTLVQNSFAAAYVHEGTWSGSLIGYIRDEHEEDIQVLDSYSNYDINPDLELIGGINGEGNVDLSGSEQKSIEDLTDHEDGYPEVYVDWNFEDIWEMTDWNYDMLSNRGYPALEWQEVDKTRFLEIEIDGLGKVDPSKGIHAYEMGDVVDLTAMSYGDSRFVTWDGDVNEEQQNEKEIQITMDEDKSLIAQFETTTESTITTGEVEESLMEQHSSEGFLVTLNDKTVLNLFRRAEGHIGPPGQIMQRYYDIESGEWTEPEVVYNSSYDDRNVHGGITDGGRVVAFFRRRDEEGDNVDTNVIYSDDGGETWSERIDISDIFESGSFRPIGTLQKMEDRYIMPSYDINSAEIISSKDGIEWQSEAVIYKEHHYPNINELDIAYLGDGNLVAIFRTDGKHLQKTSTDYGETWSQFETTNIIDHLEYGEGERMRKPELLYREDIERLYVITSENTDPPEEQRLWICSQDVSDGLPHANGYIIEDYKYRPLRDVSTRYFYGYPTYTQIGEYDYLIVFSDTDHATTGDEDVFLFQFTMTIDDRSVNDDEDESEIPGFTFPLLVLGTIFTVIIFKNKT